MTMDDLAVFCAALTFALVFCAVLRYLPEDIEPVDITTGYPPMPEPLPPPPKAPPPPPAYRNPGREVREGGFTFPKDATFRK